MRFTMTASYPVCSFWQEVINTCGQVEQITDQSNRRQAELKLFKEEPNYKPKSATQSVLRQETPTLTDIRNDQSQSFLFRHETSEGWGWGVGRGIDHRPTSLCRSECGLSGPAGLHEA